MVMIEAIGQELCLFVLIFKLRGIVTRDNKNHGKKRIFSPNTPHRPNVLLSYTTTGPTKEYQTLPDELMFYAQKALTKIMRSEDGKPKEC